MNINIYKALKCYKGTKQELAKEIGVNPQWLTNQRNPKYFPKTLKTMIKLSEVTGLTLKELINTKNK